MKKHLTYSGLVLLFFSLWFPTASAQSVLSSGSWYKVAIIEEGIYKVDAGVLKKLGINRKDIDPRNLAIYGNAYNGMLSQSNSAERPQDLIENARQGVGFEDGVFDKEDYFLFYGKPAYGLSFDADTKDFAYQNNIYSDSAFYFITIKDEPALNLESSSTGNSTGQWQESYLRLQVHELEETNVLETGRDWFGERVSALYSDVNINFDSEGLIAGPLKLYVSVASQATVGSQFSFSIGGQSFGETRLTAVSGETYDTWVDVKADTLQLDNYSGANFNMLVKFSLDEGTARGYVDYVNLVSRHALNLNHRLLSVYVEETGGLKIEGPGASAQAWDVSSPTRPKQKVINATQQSMTFGVQEGQHIIAFDNRHIQSPISKERIRNQNLRAMPSADVLYITHPSFLYPTQRLAEHRLQHDGLKTEVVTIDQIYNEFSSGRQDVVAIRDFIRHHYVSTGQLKYVTLVGDCSYDYKKYTRNHKNFVPVYEARNSVHRLYSYSSEDFYGFMEEDEGEWIENSQGDHTLDIGVGRIPVASYEEAMDYVNKVIRYETSSFSFGPWKNKVVYFADDGDFNIHQRDADRLSAIVDTASQEFNVRKVFLDQFEQEGEIGFQTSPRASQALIDALEKGSFLVNYTGHGNEFVLADEDVLTEEMIDQLTNRNQLPFFVTATCQFGKYDDPALVSGGEKMLLSPQGGAIALLTSTRAVVASSNYTINRSFYEAFTKKESGQYRRLGDIMMETKNNSLVGPKNRNYALLGDASMRLAFPSSQVRLTSINDKSIDQLDTLSALGVYTISGQIENDGILESSFKGTVKISIYDEPASYQTLGDESVASEYEQRDILLFQGEASVENGLFSTEVILSRDMELTYGKGKINFYALNDSSNWDAAGSFTEVIVGGLASVDSDNSPPLATIYFDDVDYQEGDRLGRNPLLLVRLKDESGINVSKLNNQGITASLDGSDPFDLNDFYFGSVDDYQEGWVMFPFSSLDKGEHELVLTAYDNHGNEVVQSARFVVSDHKSLEISEFINYPNPMQDITTFSFSHDRAGEDLDISLSITNLQGQLILHEQFEVYNASNPVDDIHWNGKDLSGNKVKKGIYIYKLIIQSRIDGASTSISRKLVISD
ncbi:type IX secretion system sortase PorU [Reichenbachiella ulvae]|uniref:Type IX secretion system sortase PorU n=1 Tax=Reichenbachiella ulvae TaxID=2980104 RepID=A0ABT3CWV8_9BACT|nr:type IX secretion system sortase PorU [Reichenbachiella ulvae]MCV9388112.1 type IX secretion system sortase PorU [Reichenbachiella ulvae]